MVARTDSTGHEQTARRATGVSGLLLPWRRVLTRCFRTLRALASSVVNVISKSVAAPARLRGPFGSARLTASEALRAMRAPTQRLADADGERLGRLTAAGATAVAVGGLLAVLVGWIRGLGPLSAGIDGMIVWTWAVVRLALLAWTAPSALRGMPIRAVWGVGAVPTLVAATPALSVAAFVSGAWLTLKAAQGAGAGRSQALGMVLTAFGAQLAVVAASWIFRAGILLVI